MSAETRNGDKIWVVVGDIHGDMANFAKIPELAEASGIIVSGDLTNLGGREAAARVMENIEKLNLPVYAQIGNMDKPEVDSWLSDKGINIHCKTRELASGIAIFGVGGSTPTPFHTPSEFGEDMISGWLEDEWQEAKKYPLRILVSHNPPKDTPCDDIGNGVHVGSEAVRDFILERQPDLCVCGHIHEGRAMLKLSRTIVANPGTLADGGYVVVRLHGGELSAELGQIGQ